MAPEQTTFADIAEHTRTTGANEPGGTAQSSAEPDTKAELVERAREYAVEVAAEHFPELPVETVDWEVSTRAERRAGVTEHDPTTGDITVRLTWDAYTELGWEKMCRTIRHELIHVWQCHEHGGGGHGAVFRARADDLNVDVHCERFKQPKYWVVCEKCGEHDGRYKRSKVVKQPERYTCSCGGSITVEPTDRA
jgi:SprT-like protein